MTRQLPETERGMAEQVVAPTSEDADRNSAAAPPKAENEHYFREHAVTQAVRHEVRRYIEIGDSDLAWIVEAALWHAQRLAHRQGMVDLDYMGTIARLDAESAADVAKPLPLWVSGD